MQAPFVTKPGAPAPEPYFWIHDTYNVNTEHPLSCVQRKHPLSQPGWRVWSTEWGAIGKIPGILRVYLENPGIPGKYLGIVPISSILPQILPQTSSQTQGKQRVSRMEHQTPSVFPGNFRKRKVLGTLSFPFCFSENCENKTVPSLTSSDMVPPVR